MMPSLSITSATMPRAGWYIHAHVVAATEAGTTQGIRIELRKKDLPLKFWFTTIPVAVPRRIWNTTDTPT